ncbi:MAG: type III pantothenate kinase [Bacillaceae bacterium]|nr:type III pantothenate kinase [Bacillaceae bacterium]
MILVMDVGNTNIVMGVYEGKTLKHHWRITTNRNQTEDEYGMLIKNLFHDVGITFEQIEGVIISSVVPPLMFVLEKLSKKYLKQKPLIVGPGIKTGLNIKYENPREVGADRIVNAVAGVYYYGSPLIIVDFGTATTFCYIDESGSYMGGVIAPGINIATEALYSKASKLPRIEIVKPDHVVGKNTVNSMQSGIFYGFLGQVEGIVSRMKEEALPKEPVVVATGGLARLICEESPLIDHLDPLLTLKGLQIIYERNQ